MLTVAIVACSDSPTAPHPGIPPGDSDVAPRFSVDGSTEGCVSDGFCVLPPISVGGGECDPWMDANGCEDPNDGECLEAQPVTGLDSSSVSTCGGGGSGVGGDGGGTSGGTADSGADPSKQTQDDTEAACPGCDDREPTAAEAQIMENLLTEVRCADGLLALQQMLGNGSLRVYTTGNSLYGAWDSDAGEIYINWPKHVDNTGTLNTEELIDTMVHEVVHKLLGHINDDPWAETHASEFRDKMASCGFPQP